MKDNKELKQAFLDTVPVMAGYIVLGMGFGIILKNAGYGVWIALAMSVFIYAGSMQYLAVGLISGGASYLTMAITTLMVNARHLFYGISMVEKYRNVGKSKPYLIFGLTDETYSLVCTGKEDMEQKARAKYYFRVTIFDQIYWITGSVIGSLLGSVLTFNTEGVDYALTALFITVFTDQWLKTKNHVSAIIGVVASVICLVIFGTDDFLIPTMILIVALLFTMKKYAYKEVESNE